MKSIVYTAIRLHREATAAKAVKLYNEMCELQQAYKNKPTDHNRFMFILKAKRVVIAFRDTNDLHAELETGTKNPDLPNRFTIEFKEFDNKTIIQLLEDEIEPDYEEAAEYAEDMVEDAALTRFHYNAYGRD